MYSLSFNEGSHGASVYLQGSRNSNTTMNYLSHNISESCLSDTYGITLATTLVLSIIKDLPNYSGGLLV